MSPSHVDESTAAPLLIVGDLMYQKGVVVLPRLLVIVVFSATLVSILAVL
jgi:hypothetical protein